MQFKVGDRVEVVEPAECVEEPNNRLGTGTILDADDREYFYVKVDSNTKPWWYAERCLRALPTPTPSITVGTQVRLTGVVTGPIRKSDEAIGVQIDGATAPADMVFVVPTALEVIRQPFKRGEVVYNRDESEPEPFVVLNDESLGMVDVACCRTGFHIANDNPEAYERRP